MGVPESSDQNSIQAFDNAIGYSGWNAISAACSCDPLFNLPVDDWTEERNSTAVTDRLDAIFAALSDPTRRAILAMLLEDDMAVTDVAEPFAISLAAISKHLGVLADAGLITRERRGRVIWCKLDPDAMRTASVWMQGFGQFEPLDLDEFERFLEVELGKGTD